MTQPSFNDPFANDAASDIEFSRRQWQNRRRIAFISLWTAISLIFFVATAAILSDAISDRLDKFQMFLATGITGLFGLAGAYMGFATWQDVKVPIQTPSQRRTSTPTPAAPPPKLPSPADDETVG